MSGTLPWVGRRRVIGHPTFHGSSRLGKVGRPPGLATTPTGGHGGSGAELAV